MEELQQDTSEESLKVAFCCRENRKIMQEEFETVFKSWSDFLSLDTAQYGSAEEYLIPESESQKICELFVQLQNLAKEKKHEEPKYIIEGKSVKLRIRAENGVNKLEILEEYRKNSGRKFLGSDQTVNLVYYASKQVDLVNGELLDHQKMWTKKIKEREKDSAKEKNTKNLENK